WRRSHDSRLDHLGQPGHVEHRHVDLGLEFGLEDAQLAVRKLAAGGAQPAADLFMSAGDRAGGASALRLALHFAACLPSSAAAIASACAFAARRIGSSSRLRWMYFCVVESCACPMS